MHDLCGLVRLRPATGLPTVAFILAMCVGSVSATKHETSNVDATSAPRTAPFFFLSRGKNSGWTIIRIVPPGKSGELGTIIFGEGEGLISPTSIRGPK